VSTFILITLLSESGFDDLVTFDIEFIDGSSGSLGWTKIAEFCAVNPSVNLCVLVLVMDSYDDEEGLPLFREGRWMVDGEPMVKVLVSVSVSVSVLILGVDRDGDRLRKECENEEGFFFFWNCFHGLLTPVVDPL